MNYAETNITPYVFNIILTRMPRNVCKKWGGFLKRSKKIRLSFGTKTRMIKIKTIFFYGKIWNIPIDEDELINSP